MRKHIASYVSAALLIGGLAVAVPLAMSAADPVVTNVTATQRVGTNLVDVAYSLNDAYSPTLAVTMLVSTNAGVTFDVACPSAAGDVGANVATGANKQIVWNGGADLPDVATSQLCVRILADDGGMVLIPAGAFQMGTNNLPYENEMSDAGPNHTVTLSAFYMGKYEVTYSQWTNVHTWAASHDYTFDHAGSGKATNHPVQSVCWYDMVKWCNARSEMLGLTPCYYTNAAQTVVYRTGNVNLSNEWVKWSANGYRLPTEAEWEKAARGGLTGRRFPWQDLNITHTNANYYSSSSYAYDTSATRGYHPLFNDGVTPYTSPVGSFAPNGYGLYDMAGNVFEWCWDWYGGTYYARSPGSDPRGPGSGTYRVLRGGYWSGYASGCRVAIRNFITPDYANNNFGFRCVRGL